jgi:hypothetical protein
MRRRSDDWSHIPRAVLLHADGTISNHYFDLSQEVFTMLVATTAELLDHSGFASLIDELRDLRGASLDFVELLLREADRGNKAVAGVIRRAIDAVRK